MRGASVCTQGGPGQLTELTARQAQRPWLSPALVLPSTFAWFVVAAYFAGVHGPVEASGLYTTGRDFVIFWTGAQLLASGRIGEMFQPEKFHHAAQAMTSPSLSFHFWAYPPTTLFMVAPFGHLQYLGAFVFWTVVGAAALLIAGRAYLSSWREAALLLASPAAASNVIFGQNGFFTASIILIALAAMPKRPRLAGAAIGLLAIKPKAALLMPIALGAANKWRTFTAAAVIAISLTLLSAAVFGLSSWRAYLHSTLPVHGAMMQGFGPIRLFSPTAFMSGLILFGRGVAPYLTQLPFTLIGCAIAWKSLKAVGPWPVRTATLLVATLVATPQAFNYDMVASAAASLILWRYAKGRADKALAATLWITPIAITPLNVFHAPVSPIFITAVAIRLHFLAQSDYQAAAGALKG